MCLTHSQTVPPLVQVIYEDGTRYGAVEHFRTHPYRAFYSMIHDSGDSRRYPIRVCDYVDIVAQCFTGGRLEGSMSFSPSSPPWIGYAAIDTVIHGSRCRHLYRRPGGDLSLYLCDDGTFCDVRGYYISDVRTSFDAADHVYDFFYPGYSYRIRLYEE